MAPVTRRLDRGDGFVARNATEADIPAILSVLMASFSSWPPVPTGRSAREFLEWKMPRSISVPTRTASSSSQAR